MKALFKALAGVVIAASTSMVAAQPVTLNFNDLPTAGGLFSDAPLSGTYQGFTFVQGLPGTPASAWMWAAGTSNYPSGVGPAGNPNATGIWNLISPPSPPVGQFDAFIISSPTPFTVQSATFSGCCGPLWVAGTPAGATADQILDGTIDVPLFSAWNPQTDNFTNAATAAALLNPGSLNILSNANQTFLTQMIIWAPAGSFAIDDINMTMVPEPSSYAMMIAGLGALGFVARRRKNKASAA